jgi:hypothetical protein
MDRETASFLRAISGSLDRIVACLDGLDAATLNRRLPIEGANSLYAIATHALANAERNVLGTYCGEPYDWQREAEFAASGDSAEPLRHYWRKLEVRMREGLAAAGPAALARECDHPRLGRIHGREVLLQAARHAAEHVGEAELTRRAISAPDTLPEGP